MTPLWETLRAVALMGMIVSMGLTIDILFASYRRFRQGGMPRYIWFVSLSYLAYVCGAMVYAYRRFGNVALATETVLFFVASLLGAYALWSIRQHIYDREKLDEVV